jgi:hypothetical protein
MTSLYGCVRIKTSNEIARDYPYQRIARLRLFQ